MGIRTERIQITVEADLDLRGTLGIAKDVPVGFERDSYAFLMWLLLRQARTNCALCEMVRPKLFVKGPCWAEVKES